LDYSKSKDLNLTAGTVYIYATGADINASLTTCDFISFRCSRLFQLWIWIVPYIFSDHLLPGRWMTVPRQH